MDKELLGSEVFDINTLTVVASDSYASFVSNLQNEMKENMAERPRKADDDYFKAASGLDFDVLRQLFFRPCRRAVDDSECGMFSALDCQPFVWFIVVHGLIC